MKLKTGFITHTTGQEQILVCAANRGFSGLVRLNPTAAFMVELLKEEISEEALAQTVAAHYGIDLTLAQRDVAALADSLRSIQALDE